MLTNGAPHSSTEARHSSTVSLSLMVCEYSRIRPQPVQVRLHACSGSSIRTSGNRFTRVSFFLAMYAAIEVVNVSGKRMECSFAQRPAPRTCFVRRLVIAGQGHQGEIKRIHMVFQIEDFREPGPGERHLVPGAES